MCVCVCVCVRAYVSKHPYVWLVIKIKEEGLIVNSSLSLRYEIRMIEWLHLLCILKKQVCISILFYK